MAIFRMPRKDSDLTAQSELSLRSTHMQSYRKCCGPAHNVFINCKCYSGKLMIMYYFQVVIYRETNSSESLNTIEPRYLELAYFLRSNFSSFPHYYIYIYISNFRSQITYSFVKCGCSIYCFPHSLNSDMSKYGYLEVFH